MLATTATVSRAASTRAPPPASSAARRAASSMRARGKRLRRVSLVEEGLGDRGYGIGGRQQPRAAAGVLGGPARRFFHEGERLLAEHGIGGPVDGLAGADQNGQREHHRAALTAACRLSSRQK